MIRNFVFYVGVATLCVGAMAAMALILNWIDPDTNSPVGKKSQGFRLGIPAKHNRVLGHPAGHPSTTGYRVH